MRRGRIFIYLALIIIIGTVTLVIYLRNRSASQAAAVPTPIVRVVDVVIAGQNIPLGTQITEEMLSSMKMAEDQVVTGLFRDPALVVGQYAKYPIDQGVPITSGMISPTSGISAGPGSPWRPLIPRGMTAIAIPITRLSSMAFGIRDGDQVDVIATMQLVDVDTGFQSVLPNNSAGVIGQGSRAVLFAAEKENEISATLGSDDLLTNIVAQSVSGMSVSPYGRAEFDSALQSAFYVVASEPQRPRIVSQMFLQNIEVLHVGTFPLPGETSAGQLEAAGEAALAGVEVTPTPSPAEEAVTALTERPDVITLIVTPQDAVTLTYLMFSGAQITLTLRGPSADDTRISTEAVTLQYLLTQYDIPVPAKLPYALNPRVDELVPPPMPNDIIVVPPE